MCFGIIFGMILPNFSKAETLNALNDYIQQYFSSYSSIEDVDPQLLLRTNLFREAAKYLVFWISGLTVIGSYFVPLYFAFTGFIIGFTCSFINGLFGVNGLFMNVAAFIPANLIKIPALMFAGVCVISYSLKHTKTSKNIRISSERKNLLPAYTILMVFALAVSAFGAVIDSYLTPKLLLFLVEKVI
jgi:stage II sporulation protein M